MAKFSTQLWADALVPNNILTLMDNNVFNATFPLSGTPLRVDVSAALRVTTTINSSKYVLKLNRLVTMVLTTPRAISPIILRSALKDKYLIKTSNNVFNALKVPPSRSEECANPALQVHSTPGIKEHAFNALKVPTSLSQLENAVNPQSQLFLFQSAPQALSMIRIAKHARAAPQAQPTTNRKEHVFLRTRSAPRAVSGAAATTNVCSALRTPTGMRTPTLA